MRELKKEKAEIISMNKNFVILGYGVPSSITEDENYNIYLKTVFNNIFDLASEDKAVIIFSGGKTDLVKPYKRTEADEMAKLFTRLMKRSFLRKETKDWQIMARNKPISSLENLLEVKDIIREKKLSGELIVFCEQSRAAKVSRLIQVIFKGKKVKIIPIDFDNSINRYDNNIIRKKENKELQFAIWALKNEKNLEKHHQMYLEKLNYLRKAMKSERDFGKIRKWWEKELKELKIK